MILKNINHNHQFDMKNISAIFFPYEKIQEDGDGDIEILTEKSGDVLSVKAKVYDKEISKEHILTKNEDEATALSVLLYNALSELLNYRSPWGILFGVRPAKLMHRLCGEMGEREAADYFNNSFLVKKEKTELTLEVMKHENKIISLSKENSFSLYISIPFCPSRCSYCSFVSHSVEKTEKLVEPYVELLCKELEEIGKIAKYLGLRLETVYFGGGTPTTLSPELLGKLLKTVESSFDLSNLREYTVEAGRPDTVDKGRLLTLKNAGITRISINPQSFNDSVLEAIGRRHTAKQAEEAFELARKLNFDNINMDLIAGLPKDNFLSFKNSVEKAVSLGAESVTVHTLALKSASYIVTKALTFDKSDSIGTHKMVDYSAALLKNSGYYPYYMYRQSKSLGNLENTGWCKEGRDCLYNVYMMDETHSVLAAGAGAVTRLKNQKNGYIERIYNYKYPYEYIDGFQQVLERKKGIISFYEK